MVNGTDLKPRQAKNCIDKYADDSYLIVPACNDHTAVSELLSVELWASNNNLKLNRAKSQEMIICSSKKFKRDTVILLPEIARVNSIKILGVTIDENLSVKTHVAEVCQTAAQSLYAIKLLKSHGLDTLSIYDVCSATVVSRLTYASPAWWGFTTAEDRQRLQATVNRPIRWGFYGKTDPTIEQLCAKRDTDLFVKVRNNPVYVLHQFLPPKRVLPYNLRLMKHQRELPDKSGPFADKTFFNRILYQ